MLLPLLMPSAASAQRGASEIVAAEQVAIDPRSPHGNDCATGDVNMDRAIAASGDAHSPALANALVPEGATAVGITIRLEAGIDNMDNAEKEPPAKRLGLNPYLTFKNQLVKTAKEAASGRQLTPEDMKMLTAQAKERWAAMPHKGAHAALYEAWQETPAESAGPMQSPYKPIWGGGCRGCPVSALELCIYHNEHGWPRDAEVFDTTAFHATPDQSKDFRACAGFDLWGCHRSASTVCKRALARSVDYETVHRGLCDYLSRMPKDKAESSMVAIMVEGKPRSGGGRIAREIGIIAGTCWSPKVFDIALCHFGCVEDATSDVIALPFEFCLSHRVVLGSPNISGRSGVAGVGGLAHNLTSVKRTILVSEFRQHGAQCSL